RVGGRDERNGIDVAERGESAQRERDMWCAGAGDAAGDRGAPAERHHRETEACACDERVRDVPARARGHDGDGRIAYDPALREGELTVGLTDRVTRAALRVVADGLVSEAIAQLGDERVVARGQHRLLRGHGLAAPELLDLRDEARRV